MGDETPQRANSSEIPEHHEEDMGDLQYMSEQELEVEIRGMLHQIKMSIEANQLEEFVVNPVDALTQPERFQQWKSNIHFYFLRDKEPSGNYGNSIIHVGELFQVDDVPGNYRLYFRNMNNEVTIVENSFDYYIATANSVIALFKFMHANGDTLLESLTQLKAEKITAAQNVFLQQFIEVSTYITKLYPSNMTRDMHLEARMASRAGKRKTRRKTRKTRKPRKSRKHAQKMR